MKIALLLAIVICTQSFAVFAAESEQDPFASPSVFGGDERIMTQEELQKEFETVQIVNNEKTVQVDPSVSDDEFFRMKGLKTQELEDGSSLQDTEELTDEEKDSIADPESDVQPGKGYQVTTYLRGPVKVHDAFITVADEHHQHFNMKSRPTNDISDEDPIRLLGHHASKMLQKVAEMGVSDKDQNLDLQFIKNTGDWTQDRHSVQKEGSIAGEFIVPNHIKVKYNIAVGTMFSLPSGLFKVKELNQPASAQGDSDWQLQCENAGLLDAIEDGDVVTEVEGTPEMARDETTGEVEDMRLKSSLTKDKQTLQDVYTRLRQHHLENIRDQAIDEALEKVDSHLWKAASSAVPADMVNGKTIPELVKATKELRDTFAGNARDFFMERAQPILNEALARYQYENDGEEAPEQVQEPEDEFAEDENDDVMEEDADSYNVLSAPDSDELQDQDFWGRRIKRAFRRVGRRFRRGFRRVGRFVRRGIRRAGRFVRRAARRVGRFVRRTVRKIGRGLKKFGRAIIRGVKKWAGRIWKAFKKIAGKFLKVLKSIGNVLAKIGQAIAAGVKKLGAIIKTLAELLTGKLDIKFVKGVKAGKRVTNQDLIKKEGKHGKFLVRATEAEATLYPRFELAIKVRKFKLKMFKVMLAGDLRLAVGMLAQISKTYEKTKDKRVVRYRVTRIKFMAGPVPVFINVEFTIKVGVTIKVTAGIQTTFSGSLSTGFRMGLIYDGKFRGVMKKYFKKKIKGPPGFQPCAKLEVELFVRPQVAFLLYGVAGPTFGLEPYLKLEFVPQGAVACVEPVEGKWDKVVLRKKDTTDNRVRKASEWDIYLGLRGLIGVRIQLLGKELLDKNWPVFDKSKKILSGKFRIPIKGRVNVREDDDYSLEELMHMTRNGEYSHELYNTDPYVSLKNEESSSSDEEVEDNDSGSDGSDEEVEDASDAAEEDQVQDADFWGRRRRRREDASVEDVSVAWFVALKTLPSCETRGSPCIPQKTLPWKTFPSCETCYPPCVPQKTLPWKTFPPCETCYPPCVPQKTLPWKTCPSRGSSRSPCVP
eukprot:TRINITY_DN422_c0_g1_i9.p1 TRINITY_DN422_c0_g1~~TRINITY_DN422_c0_g1_i9.p1  ORF type:complete len:1052 (-),score=344.47 TRINITY_DN422_c0_g1_i9:7-3141(-)